HDTEVLPAVVLADERAAGTERGVAGARQRPERTNGSGSFPRRRLVDVRAEPPRARLGSGGESRHGGEGLAARRTTHRKRARDRWEGRQPHDWAGGPCTAGPRR